MRDAFGISEAGAPIECAPTRDFLAEFDREIGPQGIEPQRELTQAHARWFNGERCVTARLRFEGVERSRIRHGDVGELEGDVQGVGSESQQREWLSRIAAGETVATLAITETPGTSIRGSSKPWTVAVPVRKPPPIMSDRG